MCSESDFSPNPADAASGQDVGPPASAVFYKRSLNFRKQDNCSYEWLKYGNTITIRFYFQKNGLIVWWIQRKVLLLYFIKHET